LRILAISDIHGAFGKLDKVLRSTSYDLLIVAGDLAPYHNPLGFDKAFSIIAKHVGDKVVAVVAGNMDSPSLIHYKPPKDNIFILHGDALKVNDDIIVGFGGGLVSPFYTYFELTEDEFKKLIDSIKDKLSVVKSYKALIAVFHNPPKGTKVDVAFSGAHVGSKVIREFIEELSPKLVICGHIHEARGYDRLGETVIVNPGPLLIGYYALIDIDDKVQVVLKKI